MKKSLIAGAGVAALAMAAVPFAGVFATADLTDTLSIEVQDNCALTYRSTAHTDGTGTWSSNTLSASLAAGSSDITLGSSAFNVICNNQSGWHVTAEASSLNATVDSNNHAIPNATANTEGSVYHFTPAKVDTTDNTFTVGAADAGNMVTMSAATDTSGKDFNVTYTTTIGATQAADTYEGTIGYTLVKGPAS